MSNLSVIPTLNRVITRLEKHEEANASRMNERDHGLLERAIHVTYLALGIITDYYGNDEDNLASHYEAALNDGSMASIVGEGASGDVSVLELDKLHKLMWSILNDFHDHVSYVPEPSFSFKSVVKFIFGSKE